MGVGTRGRGFGLGLGLWVPGLKVLQNRSVVYAELLAPKDCWKDSV